MYYLPNKKRSKSKLQSILSITSAVLLVAVVYSVAHKVSPSNTESSVLQPQNERQKFQIEEKVFGTSVAGKEIKGYVMGSGANTLLLFGSQHGDEMGTAMLLNQLVEEVSKDNSLVSPKKKLIIIPISNPDGYYDRTDKLNANEVNLNLNFGTSDWQKYGPEGTFAGNQPFSEPESQIIREVVEEYKPNMMISFHSQGAVVSPEASPESHELAQWYAKKSGYEYYNFWDYPGTATKWFEQTTGKPAITIELREHLKSDWESHEDVLLELISKGPNK